MSEIFLRPAQRNDAAELAILDNLAGHGISQWFWQMAVDQGEGEDAFSLGRTRLAQDDAIYGWKNFTLAIEKSEVLGGISCYLMTEIEQSEIDDLKRNAPAMLPLFELFDLANRTWFLDSLAVYTQARRRGVAHMLVDFALEKGAQMGHTHATIVVENSNTHAFELYRSKGFDVIDQRDYIEFNGSSESTKWLLLSKEYSKED